MPRARVHLHVSGRVQGVFFRASAKEKADELGVVGWVRNLPDGRVEAVAEGERSAVEALVEWCRQGPPGARVEHLDADWAEPSGEFARFETRYH